MNDSVVGTTRPLQNLSTSVAFGPKRKLRCGEVRARRRKEVVDNEDCEILGRVVNWFEGASGRQEMLTHDVSPARRWRPGLAIGQINC